MNTSIKNELETHVQQLKAQFYSKLLDTYEVKNHTMSGNTARAYEKGKCYNNYAPKSIFKHWVHHKFLGDDLVLKDIQEGADFEKIHLSAIQSLRHFWLSVEPGVKDQIQFYHFSKLVDLLFKSISRWEDLPAERREWFFNHAKVPLDKYSLAVLGEFNPKYYTRTPSMNNIKNEAHYYEVQEVIKNMISPFPPMLFDLYAWDFRRRQQIIREENYELIKV